MGLFPDKDMRIVGISIVAGIFMTMVYDVIRSWVENGLDTDVSIRIIASVVAMFLGLGLLKYFDITHRKKTSERIEGMNVRVIHGESSQQIEDAINAVICGKKVKDIKYEAVFHEKLGNIEYTALIIFE